MRDIFLTAFLSIVTSAITAYVAARISLRVERKKWMDQFGLELAKLRIENPHGASRLAQDFGVAFLVVRQPGQDPVKVFVPPSGSLSIGRANDCDVIVNDPIASLHHLLISCRDGSVWISDLASRGGAKLNGNWIAERTALKNGDEISVGMVSLAFNDLPKA